MSRHYKGWYALFVLVFLMLGGCSGTHATQKEEPAEKSLRVGITPDYPPIIFQLNGKITGVEADLAQGVAQSLHRRLEFVQMKWDALIPGLMAGTIDIIMSGMTVTQARTMQVDFTDPYFRVGILACMRAEDVKKFDSVERILNTDANVGVIPGTTSDAFVTRNFPRARRIAIAKAEHAALELTTRRIDLFVADGPAVVWLVSRNEADLAGFWQPLTREVFAWGVNRGNRELLTAVNGVLAQWKGDGTLHRVLLHWLPYLDRIQQNEQ
jgi:ABC-type amino acid transport substrate-binding protein